MKKRVMFGHRCFSVCWLLIASSYWLTHGVIGEDAEGDTTGTTDEAGEEDSEDAKYQNLWVAHGLMMGIAFAVLIPIGIGCSLLRHLVPGKGLWFKLHMFINGTAFLLMTAAFGIAVYVTEQLGDDHFKVSDTKHKAAGLAVYVLSFVQVIAGVLRPHLPDTAHSSSEKEKVVAPNDGDEIPDGGPVSAASSNEVPAEKSLARKIFEIGHRLVGFTILGLAWYNCYTGIEIMEEDYGEAYDKTAVLWGLVGALGGSILILYGYQTVVTRKG
jgi:Eukaryotic cytochrome b561